MARKLWLIVYFAQVEKRGRKPVNSWTLDKEHLTWGGTVRYATFGEGPPLVLVHGTPFSSYVWRKVAPALAQTSSVYVFDLLGYGSSEKTRRPGCLFGCPEQDTG
jgi:pimeloyl-ACP methyl ester carboxylesterase